MPYLRLETSAQLPDDVRQRLLIGLSQIVSKGVGKPEVYVMISVNHAMMIMSGSNATSAFVDLRSIGGLTPEVNQELSKNICTFLKDVLKVSAERVFITFTDIAPQNWGWNGKTFGA